VGRLLVKLSAQNLTRLSLELGGHAPFIVFADADLDRAVEALMVAKFRNMGQTCICANRVLVEASVHAEFSARLVAAVARLRIGCGSDEGVQVGPLIDDQAVRKVESHVSDAVSKGAKIEIGGQRTSVPGLSDRFYAPTVLSGVTKNMLIFEEETFGPVCPLLTFQTEAEAISLANDSPYGLAAYFFTKDASRLMRVAEALDYGILGVNDGSPSTAQAPFGGMKHSGFGREGGHHVMHEYLEVKYLSWGL
jgi:succinate-semialdehyde dehydrogenase/glutarate-semialdehyde dehydrogenase